MDEKAGRRRTLARLLMLHGLLYTVSWLVAIYALFTQSLFFDSFANLTRYIAFVMLWTPVLMLHVGLHLYAIRWNTPNDERTAYREGYADALKQFADKTYNERLIVHEAEAEPVEIPTKRKRSG
jgi:hypothetical protein